MIAKLRHNGETCTAANRFFVEAPVVEEFGRRLAERMAALTVGPGIDPSTQLGPLVDEAGREKVEELVQAGVDSGGRVLTGGRRPADRPKGYFYEPTVVTDLPPDSGLLAEEVFGPVASLTTFEPGRGLVVVSPDDRFSLDLRLRAQFLYTLTDEDDAPAEHGLQIRRARITFAGHVFITMLSANCRTSLSAGASADTSGRE